MTVFTGVGEKEEEMKVTAAEGGPRGQDRGEHRVKSQRIKAEMRHS